MTYFSFKINEKIQKYYNHKSEIYVQLKKCQKDNYKISA